jgi:hypothetical protein
VIAVAPPDEREAGEGIPEPELVYDSASNWRSRYDGRRWQVNAAHDDYVALRTEPRGRFRYLLALLARDLVLRAHATPGLPDALEGVVGVLALAERNLRGT